MATQPTLGYGHPTEATIDQVNTWMRSTPWYQQQLRAWGQDPGHPTLKDWQSQQLLKMAQANGVVVDEGHMEVDDHGNFNPIGHKLRNTLLVAGIAGATIATMGAAGVFSGAAGAGAGAGAGGGTLASTALPTATSTIAGSVASGAVPAALSAGGATAPIVAGGGMAAHSLLGIPAEDLFKTGAGLFGNLFSAHMQTSAADHAAEIQAQAAKYAADLSAKANADALKFSYANAENAFQNNEASREGNYGVFAAREGRLGTLGESFGFGSRPVPAYVPGVDPHFGEGTASASMTGTNGSPASGVDPQVASFIADWQKTHSVSEGIAPLAAAIAKQFPGVSRYMYGQTPSDNELNVGGQKYKVLGGENGPGAYWYQPGMNDAAPGMSARTARAPLVTSPYGSTPIAPGVQIPQPLGYYA